MKEPELNQDTRILTNSSKKRKRFMKNMLTNEMYFDNLDALEKKQAV
jgi:hypothetical protein